MDEMPWNIWTDPKLPENLPTYDNIARRLKQAREALGLDMERFYGPAGISKRSALAYEKGKLPKKSLRSLDRVCAVNHVPFHWIWSPGNAILSAQ